MALRYALAAFAFGAAFVNAQSTDNSIYTVSDDYYNYGYTSRYSSKTSMFWTATVKYQDWVSTSTYTRLSGQTTTYLDTYTRTIKPTVTPTATPTYTSSYSSRYEDVVVIELYYPENAVAESDFVPTSTWDSYASASASTQTTYSSTTYFMPVTMTAPSSCPTVFTVATQASITYIPSVVADQLKPTSIDVSTSTYRSYIAEYSSLYLTAGAAPFTSADDYYYSYYIASCTPPPAQYTSGTRTSGGGGSRSGSDGDDSWTDYRACYFGGCTSLKTWIIIIATVLPGIFLLGFLESWFWYTRLMKGKSALRCGTVCWILLSLLVMCFTRMQDARSKEDQKLLQQQWKEMSAGRKFKNWSWGFKMRYPVPLLGQYSRQTVGIVPEGQPLHPAMAQVPPGQVFYYSPPPPGAHQPPNSVTPGYPMPYPQQNSYYATNAPKQGVVVGSSPVTGTATPPQAPQPVYQPPTSPAPNTQLPPQPQQAAPAPAAVPANASEAPASQPASPPAPPASPAPPAPPAPTQRAPTHAVPARDADADADDLYK